jgi:hypothetical protein
MSRNDAPTVLPHCTCFVKEGDKIPRGIHLAKYEGYDLLELPCSFSHGSKLMAGLRCYTTSLVDETINLLRIAEHCQQARATCRKDRAGQSWRELDRAEVSKGAYLSIQGQRSVLGNHNGEYRRCRCGWQRHKRPAFNVVNRGCRFDPILQPAANGRIQLMI